MIRRTRSTDGFINTTGSVAVKHLSPNSQVNPSTQQRRKQINSQRSINQFNDPEEQLLNEVKDSLDQIKDLTPTEGQTGASHRRTPAKRKGLGIKSNNGKKPKRPLTKGRIIKRIIIVLVIVLVGIIGTLAVKAFLAGSKIFNGNPLSVLTTKTRLKTDANGRSNILIFGTEGYSMSQDAWDGAMLTDSIMILSVDQDKNDAYMISLPRDLYVKHDCPSLKTAAGKLNETFYCAYAKNNDEVAGAKALMKKSGDILGMDVQYYVHADYKALISLVNAVGGVDVKIETSDPRGIYDSSTGVRYKKDEVAHLDGEKALALARARNHNAGDYGLTGSNYAREKNQQKILAALQQKAMSAGTILNPASVYGIIDGIGDNMITNFESGNIQVIIDLAKNLKSENIKQLPFFERTDGGPDLVGQYSVGDYYYGEMPLAGLYDYSELQKYIAQHLSTNPVVREGATLDVLNGSGTSGLASTKAKELESGKFIVGTTGNAPETVADKVTIYQLNSQMTKTAEALKKKYGVDITQGSLNGYQTKADFVIVFGIASNN